MIPDPAAALPMFPLGGAALPGDRLPLQVFEPRFRDLLYDCLRAEAGPWFGTVMISRGAEVGGGDQRTDVGTIVRIDDHIAVGPRLFHLQCTVGDRVRVDRWLGDDPYPRAHVTAWPDEPLPAGTRIDTADLITEITALHGLLARAAEDQGRPAPPRPLFDDLPADPGAAVYDLARLVPLGPADRFALLTSPDAAHRAAVLSAAIDTAQDVARFHLQDR